MILCYKVPEGKGIPEQALVNKVLTCKTQGVRGSLVNVLLYLSGGPGDRFNSKGKETQLTYHSSVFSQADIAFCPRVAIVDTGYTGILASSEETWVKESIAKLVTVTHSLVSGTMPHGS